MSDGDAKVLAFPAIREQPSNDNGLGIVLINENRNALGCPKCRSPVQFKTGDRIMCGECSRVLAVVVSAPPIRFEEDPT